MAGESERTLAAPSKANAGTGVPSCSLDSENRFAVVARALWPKKTAAELAYRCAVSERAAKFWLSGAREPSFDAILVIINEIRGKRAGKSKLSITRVLLR
jgi:hypothetical protein